MSGDWFDKLLNPRSVALVGASDDPSSVGGRIQGYLDRYGFPGSVYLINPRRQLVQGARTYPDLRAIKADVDVAVITVPANDVPDAIHACSDVGVNVAYIGSSAFSKTDGTEARLQSEVRRAVGSTGMRVLGPNGNGVISVRARFTASFMSGLAQRRFSLEDNGIGLVSQSGAVAAYVFTLAQASRMGIGTFVATGNEVDVTFEDVVSRLVDDSNTQIILGYVEGLRDAKKLIAAARKAQLLGKTIAILKVGNTTEGAAAALSHTAVLTGKDISYDGIFRQAGIIRAHSLSHLLGIARIVSRYGNQIGSRITAITMSGGLGIMLSDLAAQSGLTLAPWEDAWQRRAALFLPPWGSCRNPIDTAGAIVSDVQCLIRLIELADENPSSDMTIVALGNFEAEEIRLSELLVELAGRLRKPVIPIWVGGSGQALVRLHQGGLPAFAEPGPAIEALAVIAKRSRAAGVQAAPCGLHTAPASVQAILQDARAVGAPALDEVAGKHILAAYGIPTVPERVIKSSSDVEGVVHELGLPLVAKLRTESLFHKSERGAVKLGLTDVGQVRSAVSELLSLGRQTGSVSADVVIQQQVAAGREFLLGMKSDETFGPVVSLGLGGTLSEVFDDVQVRLADLDVCDAESMLGSLRHQGIIKGPRGLPPFSSSCLCFIVVTFARLARDLAAVCSSIDVNPLIVAWNGSAAMAVDALFVLSTSWKEGSNDR